MILVHDNFFLYNFRESHIHVYCAYVLLFFKSNIFFNKTELLHLKIHVNNEKPIIKIRAKMNAYAELLSYLPSKSLLS